MAFLLHRPAGLWGPEAARPDLWIRRLLRPVGERACACLLRCRPSPRPDARLWRQSVSPRNRVLGSTALSLLHPRGWLLVFQGNQRLRGLTPAKASARLRCGRWWYADANAVSYAKVFQP